MAGLEIILRFATGFHAADTGGGYFNVGAGESMAYQHVPLLLAEGVDDVIVQAAELRHRDVHYWAPRCTLALLRKIENRTQNGRDYKRLFHRGMMAAQREQRRAAFSALLMQALRDHPDDALIVEPVLICVVWMVSLVPGGTNFCKGAVARARAWAWVWARALAQGPGRRPPGPTACRHGCVR